VAPDGALPDAGPDAGCQPAAEIRPCDDSDDDCDGDFDEHTTVDHCGACGNACSLAHADPECVDEVCVIGACAPGWIDADSDPEGGCERRCVPVEDDETVCNGVDDDCDGVVDEAERCQGQRLDFCDRRRELDDLLCDDFAALAPTWRVGSLVAEGDQAPAVAAEAYRGAVGDGGGGHRRFVGPLEGAFELSFKVRLGTGEVGAGFYQSGLGGQGYALRVRPDGDVAIVWPRGEVVAGSGVDPGAAFHRVSLARRGGELVVRVDGGGPVLAVPDPYPELAPPWLSLYAQSAAEVADRAELDDLVLRTDPDGDDLFAPEDNCPETANPAQVDADGNGRGLACDDRDGDEVEDGADNCPAVFNPDQAGADEGGPGDACVGAGAAVVSMADRIGRVSPWWIDVHSGLRGWLGERAGLTQLATRPGSGDLAYVRGATVYTWQGDQEHELGPGTRPQWLVGGCLAYRADAGQILLGNPLIDGSMVALLAPEGDALAAVASTAGARLAVTRLRGGQASVRDYGVFADCGAEADGDWIVLPLGELFELPWVHPHDGGERWLTAGARIVEIDAAGDLVPLAGPGPKAVYAANGRTMLALVEGEAGLELHVGEGALRPVLRDDRLRGDTLALGEAPAELGDRDRDGIADVADRCPDDPELRVPDVDLAHPTQRVALAVGGGHLLLVLDDTNLPVNVQVRRPDGSLVGERLYPTERRTNGMQMPSVPVVWYRDHFEVWVPAPVSDGHDRIVLGPDHAMNDPVDDETPPLLRDLVEHDGVLYGARVGGAGILHRLDGADRAVGPDYSAPFLTYGGGPETFADRLVMFHWHASVRYGGSYKVFDADLAIDAEGAGPAATSAGWATASSPRAAGAVWYEDGALGYARIDADGSARALIAALDRANQFTQPALTWAQTSWGVLRLATDRGLLLRRLGLDGTALGRDVAVGTSSGDRAVPTQGMAVEWLDDRFVVVWKDGLGVHLRIGRFDCEAPPDAAP